MPTIYSWTLSSGSSGTASVSGADAGTGTGVDARRPYAFTRKFDPLTGDVLFDPARRSWALGAPLCERVLGCLRTELGSSASDPSLGVNWSPVDNARSNAAVAAELAIRRALKRFVDSGDLRDLRISTDAIRAASGMAFVFRVSFEDVRGQTFRVAGRPA